MGQSLLVHFVCCGLSAVFCDDCSFKMCSNPSTTKGSQIIINLKVGENDQNDQCATHDVRILDLGNGSNGFIGKAVSKQDRTTGRPWISDIEITLADYFKANDCSVAPVMLGVARGALRRMRGDYSRSLFSSMMCLHCDAGKLFSLRQRQQITSNNIDRYV